MSDEALEKRRRKYPRRKINKSIGILHRGDYFLAAGIDLSEGGMSFESALEIELSGALVISVQVPGGDFIIARGLITSRREGSQKKLFVYGVAFGELKLIQRRTIREFIAAKSEREFAQEM